MEINNNKLRNIQFIFSQCFANSKLVRWKKNIFIILNNLPILFLLVNKIISNMICKCIIFNICLDNCFSEATVSTILVNLDEINDCNYLILTFVYISQYAATCHNWKNVVFDYWIWTCFKKKFETKNIF